MRTIKQQVMIDLIVTPFVILPLAGGFGLMLLGVIIPPLLPVGFLCMTGGLAALAANVAMNVNDTTKKVIARMQRQARQDKIAELNKLKRQLNQDETAAGHLDDLRLMYFSFVDDIQAGKVRLVSEMVMEKIDRIFESCVAALRASCDMNETASKVSTKLRKQIKARREHLLESVGANSAQLFDVISQIRALGLKTKESEITELHQTLERDLQSALAVDKMASLTVNDDLDEQFGEYLEDEK